jgi:hypothetical protein
MWVSSQLTHNISEKTYMHICIYHTIRKNLNRGYCPSISIRKSLKRAKTMELVFVVYIHLACSIKEKEQRLVGLE